MTTQQTLMEKAAVPEFFAKVAAEVGISPKDAASARELRTFADRVLAGVNHYTAKVAKAQEAREASLIKAAAAAADLAAGVLPSAPAQVPSDPAKIAADAELYAAAYETLKAAGCLPGMPAEKAEDDDEDDKKVPLTLAVTG